jgi:thioredoxin-dependent peroxiredoxin
VILGISYDTQDENREFADAQGFPFRLLCDTTRAVSAEYGAVKDPDEQWPDVARRITYLVDPEGKVAKTYTVTDVAAHPVDVLEDVKAARTG